MRYKNSDDNRYRGQFMRSTEELMDQLTVKEFILRVLEAQRNTLQSLKQRRRLRAFVESMAGSG